MNKEEMMERIQDEDFVIRVRPFADEDGVWNGEIQNSHFYTQTYYLGNRGQYHQIYPMNKFGDILIFLKHHNEYTGTESLTKVRNKSSYTNYPSVEQLTGGQKKRIMRIYEEDYDYGWTEN